MRGDETDIDMPQEVIVIIAPHIDDGLSRCARLARTRH